MSTTERAAKNYLIAWRGHADALEAELKRRTEERDELRALLTSVRFNLVGLKEYPPDQLEACQYNIRNAVRQINAAISGVPK